VTISGSSLIFKFD